jgi:high-affinity nickel permease
VHNEFDLYCLLPASILGFRHGLDWDHIAAIADVTGGELAIPGSKRLRFFELPMLYAVGHLTSVAILAILARFLTQQLPPWLDPLMEKVVGSTLILIGFWLAIAISQDVVQRRQARFVSRWALVSSTFAKFFKRKDAHHDHAVAMRCPPKAAYGLGVLHGVGAETGTQMILLAAVAGGSNAGAIAMISAFAIGLILSNMVVAAAIAAGMMRATQTQLLSAILGFLTAIFSVLIGAYLVLGVADKLPSFADQIPMPKLP